MEHFEKKRKEKQKLGMESKMELGYFVVVVFFWVVFFFFWGGGVGLFLFVCFF